MCSQTIPQKSIVRFRGFDFKSLVYGVILRSCYVYHCHVGWSRVCRFLHLYYTCSTPIVRLLYSTYDVEIKKNNTFMEVQQVHTYHNLLGY